MEWRKIHGYEDYLVSDLGQIKSLPKTFLRNGDKKLYTTKERLLKPCPTKLGYSHVSLVKDRKFKNFMVHRLVAMAFIPNPNNHPQVNHINGIKSDNRVDNLEWCDQCHNMTHAYETNLNTVKGTGHPLSKLTDDLVRYIKGSDTPVHELAKRLNVSKTLIRNIRKGKTWKHVHCDL